MKHEIAILEKFVKHPPFGRSPADPLAHPVWQCARYSRITPVALPRQRFDAQLFFILFFPPAPSMAVAAVAAAGWWLVLPSRSLKEVLGSTYTADHPMFWAWAAAGPRLR